ncbi:MAG: hypothetical protein V1929_08245 [bacterium]
MDTTAHDLMVTLKRPGVSPDSAAYHAAAAWYLCHPDGVEGREILRLLGDVEFNSVNVQSVPML